MSDTLSTQASGSVVGADGTKHYDAGELSTWLQDLNLAVSAVAPILAFVAVSLRLFVRFQLRTIGADDWYAVIAMILSIIMAIGTLKAFKLTFIGIHYYDVPQGIDPTEGLVWIYIIGLVYNTVLAFIKQSVLAFILRIAGLNKRVRTVCWGTSIFNMAEMVAVFLVIVFQCSPVESFWHIELGQNCIDQKAFALTTSFLTIMTDIVVVALPFWVFLGLQISKPRKIGLIGVFSMGLIVTVVSSVRLYYLYLMFTSMDPDINFSFAPSLFSIEVNLAIITACAPTLWPLLQRWRNLDTETKVSSAPSTCAHCQCGRHPSKTAPSQVSTAYSVDKSARGKGSAMANIYETYGTDTIFTRPGTRQSTRQSSRPRLAEMRSFESSSTNIMSVSQGLREQVGEVRFSSVPQRALTAGRCTWPDAAALGETEAMMLRTELERIFSNPETDEDIVLMYISDRLEEERLRSELNSRMDNSAV